MQHSVLGNRRGYISTVVQERFFSPHLDLPKKVKEYLSGNCPASLHFTSISSGFRLPGASVDPDDILIVV